MPFFCTSLSTPHSPFPSTILNSTKWSSPPRLRPRLRWYLHGRCPGRHLHQLHERIRLSHSVRRNQCDTYPYPLCINKPFCLNLTGNLTDPLSKVPVTRFMDDTLAELSTLTATTTCAPHLLPPVHPALLPLVPAPYLCVATSSPPCLQT
jgi:hypothetical protein